MRSLTTAIALICCSASAVAAPMTLRHEGRLLDTAGEGLNGDVSVTIALHIDPTTAATLWTEGQVLPLSDGYFATTIGADASGNPLELSDLSPESVYVSFTVGGSELGPRQRLMSVPYAAVALKALPPIASDDIATRGFVESSTADLSTLLERSRYREDCFADFAGWPNADACLHDGRWHVVAEINGSGTYTTGDYATFRALILQGPDVRMLNDDIMYLGYERQFHAPDGSGIDSNPAVWIRIQPTPMTYANASSEDFQDRRFIFPASGLVEKGQSWYGHCGTAQTWANHAFSEVSNCDIEKMLRNNNTTDVTATVRVFARF